MSRDPNTGAAIPDGSGDTIKVTVARRPLYQRILIKLGIRHPNYWAAKAWAKEVNKIFKNESKFSKYIK